MVISIAGQASTTGEVVLEALRSRRSIGQVTAEVPDRGMIRQIIESGTWAPNHHLTEPWRFFVLQGEARDGLGRALGEAASREATDPAEREKAIERWQMKTRRAPVLIGVATVPDLERNVPEIEEISAVAAAAQNMLLAVEALGLAAIWRTGDAAFSPEVKAYFELPEHASVMGFLYVGYSAAEKAPRERTPVDAVTQWWG